MRTLSNLIRVLACCFTAPSLCVKQCWLIINYVLWHLPWGNELMIKSDHKHCKVTKRSQRNTSLRNTDVIWRSQIARFIGSTWGPTGGGRTQVGPMLAPWTLLSWVFHYTWRALQMSFRASLFSRMKFTPRFYGRLCAKHEAADRTVCTYHPWIYKLMKTNMQSSPSVMKHQSGQVVRLSVKKICRYSSRK